MLKSCDLNQKIEKMHYKNVIKELEKKLAKLQRTVKDLKIPVIILFEGWSASGKGALINKLILSLDPRSFTVHSIEKPNDIEREKPPLWRYFTKTPAKGNMAIFDRSWYRLVTADLIDKKHKTNKRSHFCNEINMFEKQLTDDNCILIKYFLHISKKEQKKRFHKLEKKKLTSWRVTELDWKQNHKYSEHIESIEDILIQTDKSNAPWTVIEADDKYHATVKMYETIIASIEKAVNQSKNNVAVDNTRKVNSTNKNPIASNTIQTLDDIDLSINLDKKSYSILLKKHQKQLIKLKDEIYLKKIPVIILYEGWDAAGKGGNIKRLAWSLDPRGYEVIPISAPTKMEKAHHYLWRFWNSIPSKGNIAIFDRSWYGRVLVERVEGFCSIDEWSRAYREINEFEKHLSDWGVVLVKFWLHIDQEEQLKRFNSRNKNPEKQWKLTDDDWRNREKWDSYKQAVNDMLINTSTEYAPWTIIEANCKKHARIKALQTVINAVNYCLFSD